MSRVLDAVETPRALTHVIGMGAAVTLFLLSLILPAKVPVVYFEAAQNFSVGARSVEFDVSMIKIRDCDPVLKFVREEVIDGRVERFYLASIRGSGGRWHETTLRFIDDESPDSAHSPSWWQRIDLGRWSIAIPPRLVPPPIRVKVPMVHLCGDERDIPVAKTMGPFNVPKSAARGAK